MRPVRRRMKARSTAQARQVTETAYEGLYYARAARTAMGLDPGPELPPLPGQRNAGAVSEEREVEVEGHAYGASPAPSGRNRHYYPGGVVAGRPVELDLVDELRLVVFPVVLGAGERLFGGTGAAKALSLVSTRRVGDGLVLHTYEFVR